MHVAKHLLLLLWYLNTQAMVGNETLMLQYARAWLCVTLTSDAETLYPPHVHAFHSMHCINNGYHNVIIDSMHLFSVLHSENST